jgi:hypothetical protein
MTVDYLSLPMLVHRHIHDGVQDLTALLEAAGFICVEAGGTRFRFLGFARGRVRE